MTKRQPTNSAKIRKNLPAFYENLFSSCQCVVSSSDSLFLAGEFARFYGGLVMLQKLPTKVLVGIEVLNEKKIVLSDTLYGYNPSTQTINNEREAFDYAKEIRLINFLKDYWPSLDPSGKIKGFRIHILSESRCGGGLGTTGVVLACLSAGLLLLANKISTKDIENWPQATVEELLNSEKYESFRKVFRLAWRLTAISRDGNSSGATSFGAMISSSYPIVFFSKNINKYLSHQTIASPQSSLENCQIIEQIPYWGGKFEEIFPLRLPQPWPVDIARIYSGALINTENIFKSLSKLKTDIESLEEVIRKEFSLSVKSKELSIDYFFNFDADDKHKFSYRDYLDIFNITAISMLLALKDLFLLGPNEQNLRKLTSVINQMQDFNHFLNHSTPLLDEICQKFSVLAARDNEFNLAGAKIEGIGKGGHVLLIAPTGSMNGNITEQIDNLAEQTGKEIYLDWASWTDGMGESGLTVEQFLPEGKVSPFISSQDFRVKTFSQECEQSKIIASEEIEKIAEASDITLLTHSGKIILKKQALNSTDIPSAKATIEIISKLLVAKDHTIRNREFANSSYGQSRYDLQSKILAPFKKAVKKYLDKDFDFSISGGMYDDFKLNVNFKDLIISVVEEI